jgi:hypothetical protein
MERTMIRIAALSFATAALIVAAGHLPETDGAPVETPFWQLHGTMPAAHDPAALVQLRYTARHPEGLPLIVAGH